jgi:hypothetical protein
MYLELIPYGKNEEPFVVLVLAWSHGMNRNIDYSSRHKKVAPRDPNPEFNVYPKDWTPETVTSWLKLKNLVEVAEKFENQVNGRELCHVTTDHLKDLNVSVLQRIRFAAATTELLSRWSDYSTPEEERVREGGDEYSVQDISCTAYMDDRVFRLIHAIGANQGYKKATLTTYHGQRRRPGRAQPQIDDEDDPCKVRSMGWFRYVLCFVVLLCFVCFVRIVFEFTARRRRMIH